MFSLFKRHKPQDEFYEGKKVKANVVIFATSNSTERLSKPLLSRFTIFEIPSYTYEEFEGIALRLIKKLHPNAVIQISSSVWKTGSRDIRDVLKVAKLCNPSDGEGDISRLITISQKQCPNVNRIVAPIETNIVAGQ